VKYEYTVINIADFDEKMVWHELNKLGLDGWVLVCIDSGNAYLSRPV